MLSLPSPLFMAGIALYWGTILLAGGIDLNSPDAPEQLEDLVAVWESEYSDDPSSESAKSLADTLYVLGVVERQRGMPEKALKHLESAIELFGSVDPASQTNAIEVKALTQQDLGDLEESERLLRTVLESRKKVTTGPVDEQISATLDHLALNLLHQGRYPEVAPLLDQAIETLGEGKPTKRARLLDHRGRLLHTLGSHSRAIDAFREALELASDDPELSLTLESQIALAQLRLGKTEEARIGTEVAAQKAAQLFENEPLKALPYINNLGELDLSLGHPQDAIASFEESLRLLETALPDDHPSLMGPLNNLGVAEMTIEHYSAATEHLERAAALQNEHLPPTHLRVAETRRNLARCALLQDSPDAHQKVELATHLGLDLLDELIREGSEKERLNFLERFELLSLPCATGDPELIANVLLASKARLLDAMLSDSEPGERITWQDVQRSLQPSTAFIDTCRYFTVAAESEEEYGAVLLLPEGPPKWIRLGSARELGIWLKGFRDRLIWRSASIAGDAGPPPPLKLRGILRTLHQNYWQPIAEQFPPETQHIAYSPSGILHFLPLSALLDEDNQPLSARHLQVATVTSGRDLLEESPTAGLNDNPWAVLTVSEFPKSQTESTDDPLLLLLQNLQSLPGIRDEADRIRGIASFGSVFLTDESASESALKNLSINPSVLHLGCHAFFLDDPASSKGIDVDFDERDDLLFSGGLVLYHGAERREDSLRISDSDDLLYPSEIAKLPLHGTRLVTLSSCDSGAGTPVSGEGVLGLRRAFALAGAREIVVALWPVSDASTPEFMEHFYRRAAASDRPAQALWQTQGDFLSTATNDEEFELAVLRYAPFVLSQNTPLVPGPRLPPAQIPESGRFASFDWRYLLAAIPFLLFVIARFSGKRKSRRT